MAVAADGFRFLRWMEGGATVSQDHTFTFMVQGNRDLLAVFTDQHLVGARTVLLQHTSGALAVWNLDENGELIPDASSVLGGLPRPGRSWRVVATDDFDADGEIDLLWQNTSSGRLAVWYMQNDIELREPVLLTDLPRPGSGWDVIAWEDFSGDGLPDLLWQSNGGALALWEMSGLTLKEDTEPRRLDNLPRAASGWRVAAIQDLDGDGDTDILWQHRSGRLAVWYLSGTPLSEATFDRGDLIEARAGEDWSVVDVRSDGTQSELIWRHRSGASASWLVEKTEEGTELVSHERTATEQLPRIPSGWRVVAAD